MTDEDVDDLAEAIRKPGGTKLNPQRAVLRAETDRWDTEFEGAINEVARVSVDATVNTHFNTDNGCVFDLLNDAVKDHQRVQTWIKSFLAKRDGRDAWIAFKAHYLGSSQMDTIASTAEDKLLMSQYHGERPRYDFERHISVHQKAHIDIEKATGTPLSGRDKVRRFLTTIKAPHMAVAVSMVLAEQNLDTIPTKNG